MNESILTRLQRWFLMKPVALRTLLAINVSIYVAWIFVLGNIPQTRGAVLDYLALHPAMPGIFQHPWQTITYGFLHLGSGLNGLLHIGFNMYLLLWMGQEFEGLYGPRRMAGLYLVGAFGGAVLTVVLHALMPGVSAFGGPVHGASGAVLAVMAAVATLWPQKRIGLLFIGVVRLRTVLLVFLAFDFLVRMGSGVSVSAHLGGALAGYLFAATIRGRLFAGRVRPVGSGSAPGSSGWLDWVENWLGNRKESAQPSKRKASNQVSDAVVVAEIEQVDVDRILDKINADGYESLSEEEKKVLYEASRS